MDDNSEQIGKSKSDKNDKEESDILYKKIAEFISTINETRKNNPQLIEHFKDSCELFMGKLFEGVDSKLNQVFTESNTIMQEKLSEINETMEKIKALEKEKEHFRSVLKDFYDETHFLTK